MSKYQQRSEEGNIRQRVAKKVKIVKLIEAFLSNINSRRATVTQFADSINEGEGINASQHIVHRSLCREVRSHGPVILSMLANVHLRKCLQRRCIHLKYILWKKQNCPDESHFLLNKSNGTMRGRFLQTG